MDVQLQYLCFGKGSPQLLSFVEGVIALILALTSKAGIG
jgi:hypothetical protein